VCRVFPFVTGGFHPFPAITTKSPFIPICYLNRSHPLQSASNCSLAHDWHMKCDCRRDLEIWLDRLPKLQAGRQPSRSACRWRAAEPPRVAFATLLVLERFNRAFRLHYLSGGSAMRASAQPKFTPMPAGQMKSASRSGFGNRRRYRSPRMRSHDRCSFEYVNCLLSANAFPWRS
jgi:hypothetical protein